jgi:poly-gamma-glutamate synthesis protein (capsule biosynthesis protein)
MDEETLRKPKPFDADGKMRLTKKPIEFRLLAAGDLCPLNRLEKILAAGDISAILGDGASVFARADLTVVNLEAPLCRTRRPIPKCGPNFAANPTVARGLAAGIANVCCLANNHIMDQGPTGLRQTLATLDKAGVKHVGAALDGRSAGAPLCLKKAGKSSVLLNFAEGEFSLAEGAAGGAAGMTPTACFSAVNAALNDADFVVVFLHAGNEQILFPSPRLRQFCRNLLDAGATAVICHHPHVPQGVEIWRNKPIAYSLGNFLFDWPKAEPETESSFFLELGFDGAGVAELTAHPFRKSLTGGVELILGRARDEYLKLLNALSAPLAHDEQMAALWDEECRMLFERRYRKRLARTRCLFARNETDRRNAALSVFNLFHCPAHREAISHALCLTSENPNRENVEIRRRLNALMNKLKSFALSRL